MAVNLGTVTRGDTEVIPLTVKNSNGVVRNVSTDTLRFSVKKSFYDSVPLVEKTVGAGIVKTAPTTGEIEVTLNPADLEPLAAPRTLYADLEVTDSGGKIATQLFTIDFILDVST